MSLLEGYKFAGGDISRLIRPQYMFLIHVSNFKADARRGAQSARADPKAKPTKSKGNAGAIYRGTPEQLAAVLKPKFDQLEKDTKEAEIERAHKLMRDWETDKKVRKP
jgi:hypothetical protein